MNEVTLSYFSPVNFGPWFPVMNRDLLQRVDKMAMLLREFGYSFTVSSSGREEPDSNSQHNVLKWGESRAVDLTVKLNGRVLNKTQLKQLYDRIRALRLFNGIGVYPDWNTPGVHVDVRPDRTPANPAVWGFVGKGKTLAMVSVDVALA